MVWQYTKRDVMSQLLVLHALFFFCCRRSLSVGALKSFVALVYCELCPPWHDKLRYKGVVSNFSRFPLVLLPESFPISTWQQDFQHI